MASHTLAPFPEELLAAKKQIRERARSYGLDFFPVIFEMCDYEQMNQIAAYGGFPQRYPHWRFGSEYEGLRKQHHYGLGRIYEMVINNDPCYAYLQESNPLVDQKLVIAHVYGHSDFFKNNLWFSQTNRKMMDEMANHATHVRKHIEKHGYDVVEKFMDVCLSLEHLIDPHSMFIKPRPDGRAHEQPRARGAAGDEVQGQGLPGPLDQPAGRTWRPRRRSCRTSRREDAPRHARAADPRRAAVPAEHARLEDWQADCLWIVREESYYYCAAGDDEGNERRMGLRDIGCSLVFTDRGLMPMGELVEPPELQVVSTDGEPTRGLRLGHVSRIVRRSGSAPGAGLKLEGSMTHRVLLPDGTGAGWTNCRSGTASASAAAAALWAAEPVPIDWSARRRITLDDAPATRASRRTVLRYREGGTCGEPRPCQRRSAVYDEPANLVLSRAMPIDARAAFRRWSMSDLAAFLGYLIGDGHISRVKRVIGLTTGDEEQADRFAALVHDLFGVTRDRKAGWAIGAGGSSSARRFVRTFS